MMTNVAARWQTIIIFSGALGYAIGDGHGLAIGLCISTGLATLISLVHG